jgi:predicted TIM-barrel fold metal-dependent hydrolase
MAHRMAMPGGTIFEYLRSGNLFFNCETDEQLIPQVVDLVGEDQLLYASDMPHGDRTPHNARLFWERNDLSEQVKRKILCANALRFYGL